MHHRPAPVLGEGLALAPRYVGEIGAGDGVVEQAVIVELRIEVQEHPAEPNCSAVHEYELPRHRHRALLLQALVHLEGLFAAIAARRPPDIIPTRWSPVVCLKYRRPPD